MQHDHEADRRQLEDERQPGRQRGLAQGFAGISESTLVLIGLAALAPFILAWLGVRYIPTEKVGVIEKLWSSKGSVTEGRIIALNGEAGYQADLLRGGLHFRLWRWQYRVHKMPLVTIPQGQSGYVYARDGEPLPPSQTLARVVKCNNFQDARGFLDEASELPGQRGRQRNIIREGVYAINPALFVVMTEDSVYRIRQLFADREHQTIASWHKTYAGDFAIAL